MFHAANALLRLGLLLAALSLSLAPAMAQAPAAQPSPGQAERPAPPPPPPQRAFATPEAAVSAMIAALGEPGTEMLARIVGPRVLEAIPPAERQGPEVRRAASEQLARMPFEIVYENEQRTRAAALFGPDRIRLPATLVRGTRGWTFDQNATIAAMRERRIGVNEANAIRALRALAAAQDAYRRRDSAGDGVLQYAQRIASRPGRTDGLVPSQAGALPGAAVGLNEAFARAEGRPNDPAFRPPGGYGFRILTAQGPAADGGAKSYLVNGRLTEGYAVIAWPIRPDGTGHSTFIMDWRGKIYEREFGADTLAQIARITAFDPGPGWERVAAAER
jgi:hypothetical protein